MSVHPVAAFIQTVPSDAENVKEQHARLSAQIACAVARSGAAAEPRSPPIKSALAAHTKEAAAASASAKVAPAYATDQSEVKTKVYDGDAGSVAAAGSAPPVQRGDDQPAGVVTYRKSHPSSREKLEKASASARGAPATVTVSAQ